MLISTDHSTEHIMIKDCKNVKANKKGFEYLSGKRKEKQNRGLLLSGAEDLVRQDFSSTNLRC